MKNRRAITGAVLLTGWQALAYFWIIALIIIIVAVAGYIIYELYRTAKQHLYGDHASISRVFVDDTAPWDNYNVAYDSDTNDVFSGHSTNPVLDGFTVSYGLTNAPWLAAGELPAALVDGPSNLQFDDAGNLASYTLVVTMNGQVVRLDENMVAGWTSTVLADDTNLYAAVIERSTDLLNWQPVFTNQIQRYSVDTWTDTDAPAERAFYRTRL